MSPILQHAGSVVRYCVQDRLVQTNRISPLPPKIFPAHLATHSALYRVLFLHRQPFQKDCQCGRKSISPTPTRLPNTIEYSFSYYIILICSFSFAYLTHRDGIKLQPSKKNCRNSSKLRQLTKQYLLIAFSFRSPHRGPGGSRTHVRTRKSYAFYMLIPAFDFRTSARPGPPTDALSSKFHSGSEAYPSYFRFTCTA